MIWGNRRHNDGGTPPRALPPCPICGDAVHIEIDRYGRAVFRHSRWSTCLLDGVMIPDAKPLDQATEEWGRLRYSAELKSTREDGDL